MSTVFDEAHNGLSGIFDRLRGEISRIENLDAQTQTKQRTVDGLAQQETDLVERVRKAQTNLDELNTAIAGKMDEHARIKQEFDALKASARRLAGLS